MIRYKLKWVEIVHSEKYHRDVIRIPLVWRWIDGKFDKFIPMSEAIEILEDAVINPEDKNTIMSGTDKKNFWKAALF